MALQIGIGSFAKPAGTGTQSVTVVDQTGAAFTPVGFVFWTMGSTGTVGFDGPTRSRVSWGFDDLTRRRCLGGRLHDNSAGTVSGVEFDCSAFYSKTYSVAFPPVYWTINPQNNLSTAGRVSAVASGSFTFNWLVSEAGSTGLQVSYLAIGGSGVSAFVGSHAVTVTGNQVVTGVGFQPTAVFFGLFPTVSDVEAGNEYFSSNMGWMSDQGCQGSLATNATAPVNPPGGTFTSRRILRHDKALVDLAFNGGSTIGFLGTYVSMDADGFTVNVSTALTFWSYFYLAINGCAVSLGSFERTAAMTSGQVSALGQDPVAVMLATVGNVASTSAATEGRQSVSAASANAQRGDWYGNANSVATSVVASYHNITDVIAATPAATASASTVLADVIDVVPGTDLFKVYWDDTIVETVNREYLTVAFGDADYVPASCPLGLTAIPPDPPIPPPTPGTPRLIRRQRVFPLEYLMNLRSTISRLEIVPQPGVGTTGQGATPMLRLEISKDGGNSYSPEIEMTVGAVGDYTRRWYTNRLGQGRNWVARVTATDPVFWALLECTIEGKPGTN